MRDTAQPSALSSPSVSHFALFMDAKMIALLVFEAVASSNIK